MRVLANSAVKLTLILANFMVELMRILAISSLKVALTFVKEMVLCPAALKSLKYWQEDAGDYCVAAAGSV